MCQLKLKSSGNGLHDYSKSNWEHINYSLTILTNSDKRSKTFSNAW